MVMQGKNINIISQFIKIIIILIIAGSIAVYFLLFQPKVKKKKITLLPTIISVIKAEKAQDNIWIETMGTVKAKRNLNIVAEVGGRITWINEKFYPGGIFKKNEILVKIDKTDYEIAIETAKSSLALSKKNLLIEEGAARSARAIEDMTRTDASKQARELRLRIPHIEAAKADLRAAEKALEKSSLDLLRTEVKAPFPILVEEENIEIGHYVTKLSSIGQAIGIDTFWIEVNIPMSKLKYLKIPGINADKGSKAIVILQGITDVKPREGRIIRILGDLDESGRMARLLIGVDDPLGLKNNFTEQPLLVNSYVKVKLAGNNLNDMIKLDRQYLRENNTLWVLDENSRLIVKNIKIGWRDNENIYISEGLQEGEQIITTNNLIPVNGMKLQLNNNEIKSNKKRND